MQVIQIILLCVGSAILYGVVHDQITARVCVEYFTVGHPPIFHTSDPTLLGLGWGVIATWWVGLVLGVPLALAARAGSGRKLTVKSLVRPVLMLLIVMGMCAVVAGLAGYQLRWNEQIFSEEPLEFAVPLNRQARFLADAWAHLASYLAGFVGGLVLVITTWRGRRRAAPRDVT